MRIIGTFFGIGMGEKNRKKHIIYQGLIMWAGLN